MKAALALVFFACVTGSMAADARGDFVSQILQQGQAVAQVVLGQLQTQILAFVQQAVGQLSAIVGAIGGRFDFSGVFDQIKPIVTGLINQALVQVLGSIQGLIGGMYPSLPFTGRSMCDTASQDVLQSTLLPSSATSSNKSPPHSPESVNNC